MEPEPPAPPTPRPPRSTSDVVLIVLLVVVDAPLVLFAGALGLGGLQSGLPEAFYGLVMLAAALAPLVVLAATRGRRVGLAWGAFLMGFVVAFGACVALFNEML